MSRKCVSGVDAADVGVFAAGHLGELTPICDPVLVDAVLEDAGKKQSRVRVLPHRVVVYFVLALGLFEQVGYAGVWAKLTGGPAGGVFGEHRVSASALVRARRRVGIEPLRRLFQVLAGPLVTAADRGRDRWRGFLVVAVDGTSLTVPDTDANRSRFGKQKAQDHPGGVRQAGFPKVRLTALVSCRTRGILAAVFGPPAQGEPTQAMRLLGALRAGMLLLADRNFGAWNLLRAFAATGADFVVRVKADRFFTCVKTLPDGSFLSVLPGAEPGQFQLIRIIDAQITLTAGNGKAQTGRYRLVTTLIDPVVYPIGALVGLYHQRWEIETTYLELKHSILAGRVLRSTDPAGVEQEIWALLCIYQILRTAIYDSIDHTVPGGRCHHLDHPRRGSFTVALETARDQLVRAQDQAAEHGLRAIAAALAARPVAARRPRSFPRIVKRSTSPYGRSSATPNQPKGQACITIQPIRAEHPTALTKYQQQKTAEALTYELDP